jgi:hypothetical protein
VRDKAKDEEKSTPRELLPAEGGEYHDAELLAPSPPLMLPVWS